MGRLFGTDGVRGVANEKLDCDLAFKLGQAGAAVLTRAVHTPRILIGRDTRISGEMLESALTAGICSVGGEAVILGVLPTSGVAYLSRMLGADAAAMISASHNSFEYNGIKFFDGNGFKLLDSVEDDIEATIHRNSLTLPTGERVGRRIVLKKAALDYERMLAGSVDVSLSGMTVVLDCAHGAASFIAPNVFRRLGANVITYYDTPDGCNINDHCGSTHPDKLRQVVVENGADLGLAFDGDADRLIAVDEYGRVVDGDAIMAICAVDMKERGVLAKNTLVGTVMSNMGLELAMREKGIAFLRTKVGDRYVLEEMLKNRYSLGGEQSGHVIFLDHQTTGDGILTGIMAAAIMARRERTLSELADVLTILPQVLINVRVSDVNAYKEDGDVMKRIDDIGQKLSGRGRVLIRPSGTEPVVRVMLEGDDTLEIENYAVELAQMIEKVNL